MSAAQSEVLQRAFKKLKTSNARISVRSLAQQLEVSHVFLGKLIKGTASIPPKLFPKLAKIFKLDELDRASLGALIASKKLGELASSHGSEISADLTEYIDLPESKFKFFANWWSFAALDLLTCELPLKLNRKTLSVLLNIKSPELDAFLDEMIRLGIVSESKGLLQKTQTMLRIPTTAASQFSRKLYQQIAGLTAKELNRASEDDFQKRLIQGYSCACNPKNIQKAKAHMAKAVKECAEILAQGECTDVYWVQGQLFSLLSEK